MQPPPEKRVIEKPTMFGQKNESTTTYNESNLSNQGKQKNLGNKMIINNQQSLTDIDRRSILLSLVCLLFLFCPIAFHLVNHQEAPSIYQQNNQAYNGDIFACLFVLIISALLVFVFNQVLDLRTKRQGQQLNSSSGISNRNKQENSKSSTKANYLLYHVFNNEELSNIKERIKNNQRKIDTKYFNPRFIYGELMEIWGTTYTVITWSSFYVVGGCIGATERFTQKMRTKFRDQETTQNSSKRSTKAGSEDNTSFCFFTTTNTTEKGTNQRQKRSSIKKSVSSWTKKSYESTKRKFSKIIGSTSGEPLLSIGVIEDDNRSRRSAAI